MEKKHEIPDFVCNCCKNNIVSGVIVICAVCENVLLCPKCFSKGSQFQEHKANHDYQIFSKKNKLSIYRKRWNIAEEYFLLEGIRLKGLGNWEGISNYLATKSIEQCKKHYQEIYLNSINFLNSNPQPIPSNTERIKFNQSTSQKIQPIEEEEKEKKGQEQEQTQKSQNSMVEQKIQQQKKKKKKNSSFGKTTFFKEKQEFNSSICSKKPKKEGKFKKRRKYKEKDMIKSHKKVKKFKRHKKKKVKKITKLRKNKKHQNTNFLKTKNNNQYQKKMKLTEIRSNPKNNPFTNYRHKLGKHTFAELSGYMPKRNEFEIEYDNTCEILTLNIGRGDHQIPWAIKNNILRFYNERILERERRKKFVISMGLLQPKSLQKMNPCFQQDDYNNHLNNDDIVIKDSFQLENLQSTRKRKIEQLQKTNEIGLEIKKNPTNNKGVLSNKKEEEKGKEKDTEKINRMIIENDNENKMLKIINERIEKDRFTKTNGKEKNKYQSNHLIPIQNFPFHSNRYERELEKKMKIFTRCFKTQSEFQQIKSILLPEYKLRKEISKLMEWKLKGINTFTKGEEFELEKEKMKQKKLKKKQNKLRKKIKKEKEKQEREKKERQEKKEKERLERERQERERKEKRLQRRETNPYRNRITQLNKIQYQHNKKGKEKEKEKENEKGREREYGKEREKGKERERGEEREKGKERKKNNDQKRVFKNQKKKKSYSKPLTKKQNSQRKKNQKPSKQKTKPKKKILKFKSKRNQSQNERTNHNLLKNSKLKSNKNNIFQKIKDNQIPRGNNNEDDDNSDEIEIKSGRILIEEDQTELLPWEKNICQEIDILPHRFLEIKNKLSNQVEFHSDPKKHQENVEIIRQFCRKNSLN
ncbi:transcriptional adapter 2-alpha [Anaeramoeba flamelloides]|uniref:Transcriptional adapter 2-alpha n=1 Tax=Anaeramoeba flamelloides TaxID=1746091 RepID=A0ABQ8YVQ6_9EUKA|nr:transcriptional adapter 2-alpha [Anaeramoeba flamelloides]